MGCWLAGVVIVLAKSRSFRFDFAQGQDDTIFDVSIVVEMNAHGGVCCRYIRLCATKPTQAKNRLEWATRRILVEHGRL
jgi:hypothetical protein